MILVLSHQHLGEERVHVGSHLHVERRHRQSERFHPDHPSHLCSQTPHAAAEDAGHSTVTDAAPLRNSIRIGASGQEGSYTGTEPPTGSEAATRNGRQDNSGGAMLRSRIQRRCWLALILLARATPPATETSGSRQASINE